jgi:8-oxo-dGTP pyrophosphatase MutT (NUDIX family)
MTADYLPLISEKDVDFRTAAAILVTPDGRYLMQLRDDKDDIPLPGMWALFGGMVEPGEEMETGLRRELKEELELDLAADSFSYFSQMVFDAIYSDAKTCQRYYFEAQLSLQVFDTLVLHEGADMRLMTAEEIWKESMRFVPCDFATLRMYMLTRRDGGRIPGVENSLSANRS